MQRAHNQAMMTADDLLALPGEDTRRELVLGFLVSEPPSGYPHARLVTRVSFLLYDFTRRRDLGEIVTGDMGFVLARDPDTVRTPDVAFISRARLEARTGQQGFFEGAPDLAVDILSPSERPGTIHGKVADYLTAGTRLVWVIDSEAENVSVYRTLLSPRILDRHEDLGGEEVLPGFSIAVSSLFER